MTYPRRTEVGCGEEVKAVAWLFMAADSPSLRPLSGEQCLTAARILLAATRTPSGSAPQPTAEDVFAAVAEAVPAVGVWLASLAAGRPAVPVHSGPDESSRLVESVFAGDSDGEGNASVIARFSRSLVLPGEPLAPPVASGGRPTNEALVLREAVGLVRDHLHLVESFDRGVAIARLEAMRELAYGAGHEINNPLANIATRAQALLLEETDPERRRRLSTIVDQSFRARDMIGGLMLFARPPKPQRESVDVGEILAAVIDSVRGQAAARTVRLEYSPLPVPQSVVVDRVQIEEAIRVIVVNSLEAVVAGGRVVIEVARRSIGSDGGCVVTVTDDGRGMSSDVARRAFDPFFSGREAGRGAGLGLPKAWRLVDSNGGTVLLASRPEHGTRVTILLPGGVPTNLSSLPAAPLSTVAGRQSRPILP